MKFPKMIPAIADLTQDIAGPVPVELLREWVAGNEDADKAAALLRPFEISGTVVATDTSGLSRLTQERDLLDVLALVSHPKEIVHALGCEVGGRAIGTWVADNTEMHYSSDVAVETVVGAMVEAQARISADAEVRIGMCVHYGDFYEIGGGLYGRDADTVEYLAERFAAPGEILLTHPTLTRVAPGDDVRVEQRRELSVVYEPGVFTLSSGPRLPHLKGERTAYPHGLTDDLFRALHDVRSEQASRVRAQIYQSNLHERVIVFVTRERDTTEGASITALLDTLVGDAVLEAIIHRFPVALQHMASLGGGLAILCFEDAEEALQLSYSIRDGCIEMGLPVKIGIDAGAVLLFAKQRGRSAISGDAVNIASKISEDLGVENMVSVTTRAARTMRDTEGGVPFRARISRVEITGIRL